MLVLLYRSDYDWNNFISMHWHDLNFTWDILYWLGSTIFTWPAKTIWTQHEKIGNRFELIDSDLNWVYSFKIRKFAGLTGQSVNRLKKKKKPKAKLTRAVVCPVQTPGPVPIVTFLRKCAKSVGSLKSSGDYSGTELSRWRVWLRCCFLLHPPRRSADTAKACDASSIAPRGVNAVTISG